MRKTTLNMIFIILLTNFVNFALLSTCTETIIKNDTISQTEENPSFKSIHSILVLIKNLNVLEERLDLHIETVPLFELHSTFGRLGIIKSLDSLWEIINKIDVQQIKDKQLFSPDICLETMSAKISGCICRFCETESESFKYLIEEDNYVTNEFKKIFIQFSTSKIIQFENQYLLQKTLISLLDYLKKLIKYYKKIYRHHLKILYSNIFSTDRFFEGENGNALVMITYYKCLVYQKDCLKKSFIHLVIRILLNRSSNNPSKINENDLSGAAHHIPLVKDILNVYFILSKSDLGPPDNFFICLQQKISYQINFFLLLNHFFQKEINYNLRDLFSSTKIEIFIKKDEFKLLKIKVSKYTSDMKRKIEMARGYVSKISKIEVKRNKTRLIQEAIQQINKNRNLDGLKMIIRWFYEGMILFYDDKHTIELTDINIYFSILCMRILTDIEKIETIRRELRDALYQNLEKNRPIPNELFLNAVSVVQSITEKIEGHISKLNHIWVKKDEIPDSVHSLMLLGIK